MPAGVLPTTVTNLSGTVEHTISPSEPDPVCTAIVAAVADAKGVDPLDLDQRLNDVVDPDALERLFRDAHPGEGRTSGHVAFTLADCEVTVSAVGTVTVVPPVDQEVTVDSDHAVAAGVEDEAALDG